MPSVNDRFLVEFAVEAAHIAIVEKALGIVRRSA